ncbi:NAD(P)H-hydrate dehydratase [Flavobacterium sp. J49]|uniref:NAD(P)H-hydrate dehydratase n=1 Tax=Flavobacterium sp. J49 TaxID=2718534 RepID=UPI0015936083|nr:NAD(P)H-hydrate dehydratase [Flavobacterium sp. J49]MBF6641448.1 NAD(P)H-hydrate dehydratase [Flavobacterium sp. J49]NIC02695.1 NAD(P)H-hydrate dehydratase [Flavobacterium sp. J49]
MTTLDLNNIQSIFKKRLSGSHKGNHGHALIIAGGKAKMGAAIIAAKSALRAGAGLVTVNIPKKERLAVFSSVPEAMIEFREENNNWEKYNAFAIGPGLGTDKPAEKKIEFVIENVKQPIVFDADTLNFLAKKQNWLKKLPPKSILTPHEKEFDRLFGIHFSAEKRQQKAIEKATELNCIIVLKSHKTFITDGKQSFQNTTGNSGLAKGGSGDALTGMITAFLAQGYEPVNAANIGVYLHGLAADITLETQSEESMLITDVIENLGKAFQKIRLKKGN